MDTHKIRIDSPIGKTRTDSIGAAIGAVRMESARAYLGIPPLLNEVIDQDSDNAWSKIIAMIDYTYEGLRVAMEALERETGFSEIEGSNLRLILAQH